MWKHKAESNTHEAEVTGPAVEHGESRFLQVEQGGSCARCAGDHLPPEKPICSAVIKFPA